MKTAKSLLIKFCVAAAMFLLANQSRALTTQYLADLSNNVAMYHAFLSTSTNAADKIETRALARALRDLSWPTATVAQDYSRFFLATLHLGKFAFSDPILNAGGVVAFTNFMTDAFIQHYLLTLTNESLNPFVRTKKAASNALVQAGVLLQTNRFETNQSAGLLRGNRIFSKLVQAQRLVGHGLTHQGFAPTVLYAGSTLVHTNRGNVGTVTIQESDVYQDADTEETVGGNYSYVRTGLNTGTLILDETGDGVGTIKLIFKNATEGRYTSRFENGAHKESGAGRFIFTAALPPG